MKKFFVFYTLCLLTTVALAMREKRDLPEGSSTNQSAVASKKSRILALSAGVDECVAAMVQGKKLSPEQQEIVYEVVSVAGRKRAQLLPKEPEVLAYDFQRELFSRCRYARLKKLLERGVDPNLGYLAIGAYCGDVQVVAVLLAYGADPNLRDFLGAMGETPIAYCRCVESARLLKRYGARIDSSSRFDVFNLSSPRLLDILIWFLSHGVDPNCGHDGAGVRAIRFCIGSCNLPGIIALMQYGVRFDVQRTSGDTSLDIARSMYYENFAHDDHERLCDLHAIYELFKALTDLAERRKQGEKIECDVREVYPLEKYESFGISRESAERIQEATLKIFKVGKQLDGDDVAYDGVQGINVAKFVHDRELGRK